MNKAFGPFWVAAGGLLILLPGVVAAVYLISLAYHSAKYRSWRTVVRDFKQQEKA